MSTATATIMDSATERKKAMQREYDRRYKQRNREKIAAAKAAYFQANKDKISARVRGHYKEKPEHYNSRQRVQYALSRGWITKPVKCEECGSEARLQAHHSDYLTPLDVKWLCQKCHAIKHRKYD